MSPSPACEKRKPKRVASSSKTIVSTNQSPAANVVRGAGVHPDQTAELGSGINLSLTDFGNTKGRGNREFSSMERKQSTERLRGFRSRQRRCRGSVVQALETEVPDTRRGVTGLGIYSAGFRSCFGSSITSPCPRWLF